MKCECCNEETPEWELITFDGECLDCHNNTLACEEGFDEVEA